MNLNQSSIIIPSSKIKILVVIIKINLNSQQYCTPSLLLFTHLMNSVDLVCDASASNLQKYSIHKWRLTCSTLSMKRIAATIFPSEVFMEPINHQFNNQNLATIHTFVMATSIMSSSSIENPKNSCENQIQSQLLIMVSRRLAIIGRSLTTTICNGFKTLIMRWIDHTQLIQLPGSQLI